MWSQRLEVPGATLTNFNDGGGGGGGSSRGSYFIPKKITTSDQNLSIQKNHYFF